MLIKKSKSISTPGMLAAQFMPNVATVPHDKLEQALVENKQRLETKIGEIRARKEALAADVEYLGLHLGELQEKLDALRPELIELRKKRENYHMWLLQRGENDDKIQTVLEPSQRSGGGSGGDSLAEGAGTTHAGLLHASQSAFANVGSGEASGEQHTRLKSSVYMRDLSEIESSTIVTSNFIEEAAKMACSKAFINEA